MAASCYHPCIVTRRHPLTLILALVLALLTSACSGDVITIGTLESDLTVPESERFLATIEALKAAGFEGGDNVRYQRRNAEVRGETLEALAMELYAKNKPALVVVFDQASLEAALAANGDVQVVAVLIGDDAEASARAGITRSRNLFAAVQPSTGGHAVNLILRFYPSAKGIGILVPPEEMQKPNRAVAAKDAAWKAGRGVIIEDLPLAEQAKQAAGAVINHAGGGAGAIYLMSSAIAREALPAVLEVANAANVPVIVADADLLGTGALAGFQADEKAIGRAAGELAAKVLRGELTEPTVLTSDDFIKIEIDPAVAERLGVTVPPDLQPR